MTHRVSLLACLAIAVVAFGQGRLQPGPLRAIAPAAQVEHVVDDAADDDAADDDAADDDDADADAADDDADAADDDDDDADDVDPPAGLVLALSDGVRPPPEPKPAPPVAEPLEATRVAELLARLPALPPEPPAGVTRLPPRGAPPPVTGATLIDAFPDAGAERSRPDATPTGPLRVLRTSPAGEQPLASVVSVTFSHPMVPLAALSDVDASRVPARLQPQPAGRWRWIDPRLLVFEAEGRFPAATRYELTVPAGTAALHGERLAEDVAASFATPPPTLTASDPAPHGVVGLQPVLLLAFDQAVDGAALLPLLRLTSDGLIFDSDHALRLATPEELPAESLERVGTVDPARVLGLVPTATLPAGTALNLTIPAGAPSAEGPRRTTAAQTVAFRTRGPLALRERDGTRDDPLRPRAALSLAFTNPLDASQPFAEFVRTDRDDLELSFGTWRDRLTIFGNWPTSSTVELTLDAGLRDSFGQTLGVRETLTVFVRSHEPGFVLPGSAVAVLDPYTEPALTFDARGHERLDVQLYRVQPDDWARFAEWESALRRRRSGGSGLGVGQALDVLTVRPDADPDTWTRHAVGLADAFPEGHGHLVAAVSTDLPGRPVRAQWLQRTDLAIDAQADGERLLVWVGELKDGAPAEGVEVTLTSNRATARTDADGLAELALPLPGTNPVSALVLARRGDDVAFLPEGEWVWRGRSRWLASTTRERLLWYVLDDRGTYRPGETVSVKGWVRVRHETDLDDRGHLPAGSPRFVSYRLTGPRGHEWAAGQVELDAFGGLALSLALPDDADPGHATLSLDGSALATGPMGDAQHAHAFQVAEFRRPEYEVTVAAEQASTAVGEVLDLTGRAQYYAGGGLPDAALSWHLSAEPTDWSPPGWDGFHFGDAQIAWPRGDVWDHAAPQSWDHAARTDVAGEHRLRVEVTAIDPPRTMRLSAEAAVTDVNAQRWAGRLERLVHPSDSYPGFALDRGFVRPGETLGLRAVLVDLDGAPVPGRELLLRAAREVWVRDGKQWRTEERDLVEATLTSALEPLSTRVQLPEPGNWRLTLTSTDERGRVNRATASVCVAGPDGRPPSAEVELESLRLVADREDYAPGDEAELLVLAPFAVGEGLVTLANGPFLWRQRFALDDGSAVLSLPLDERLAPTAQVRVDVVGRATRSDPDGTPRPDLPPRPAQAWGALELPVSIEGSRLTVEATPGAGTLPPGGLAELSIRVTDADGEPVSGANVALIVADEAVLALQPWRAPDPLEALHPARWYDHTFQQLRPLVVLGIPGLALPGGFPVRRVSHSAGDDAAGEDSNQESLPAEAQVALRSLGYLGGDVDAAYAEAPAASPAFAKAARDDGAAADPVALRARFDALAAFLPALVTDASGHVQASFTLPDSLTRYRLTAVALDGQRAGLGEAALTAQLPLMVRPSPPRMANLGDVFELPVVVQNAGDLPRTVELAAGASGLDFVLDSEAGEAPGRRVTVPAHDRVELRLPARPTHTGDAVLAVIAVDADAPDVADAARVEFPVLTPATREAFAVYGGLSDDAVRLGLRAPVDALPGFGGLELTTSSTAFAALTDAVLAVSTYPYGCAEQRASRVLAITALDEVLAAFGAAGLPPPDALRAGLASDLEHLARLQNDDGGFPFWERGQPSVVFLSAHVLAAFLAARDDDRPVDDAVIARGLRWLDRVEEHVARMDPRPDPRAAATLVAYALAVQHRAGVESGGRVLDLLESRPLARFDGEALAWLWPVVAAQGSRGADVASRVRAELLSRVTETAAEAQLASAYEQDGHLLFAGRRRGTSLLLSALLALEPDSDLSPKLVAHLLGHREAGHWGTTQENVFALRALGRAFEVLEAESPDFAARAWIDDRLLADQRFVGRSTDRRLVELPVDALAALAGDGTAELLVQSEGPGRLTWRAGLRYALPLDGIEADSRGFSVSRTYEAIEDPADVRRDEHGTWHVRRGAMVRVRLSLLAPAERHHVALVDRLPAGFEPLDGNLAVTGTLPVDETEREEPRDWFWRCFWWGGPWYDHAALRDAGAEVFAARVPADLHTYGYVVRATTPGTFLAPPASAEEMYAPETFGRSATDRVRVE